MLAQAMIENSTAKPLRRQQCVDAEARAAAPADQRSSNASISAFRLAGVVVGA